MFLAAGLLILALAGCHVKPDEKQLKDWENIEGPGEMKSGPGLLSGEEGKFTLDDSKKGGAFPREGETGAAKPSAEKTAQTSEAAGAAAATAAGTSDKSQEFQDFQEFQQWQKEKKQFVEYLLNEMLFK